MRWSLTASSGAGSKNQDLVGVNEGVRTQDVLAGDDVADSDLSWLRLQAATREQARRATNKASVVEACLLQMTPDQMETSSLMTLLS